MLSGSEDGSEIEYAEIWDTDTADWGNLLIRAVDSIPRPKTGDRANEWLQPFENRETELKGNVIDKR